jgi:hypothetical protein
MLRGLLFGARQVALFGAACALLLASSARGEERFLSPAAGEAIAPGSTVEVRWSSVCSADPDRESEEHADEAELILSYDGGLTFPVRISQEISPCASHYTWHVPSIASSQVRLALRVGREERGDEEEEIELLSEPFTILPDPDGKPTEVYARTCELWTPQAPDFLTAEDFLGETLTGAPNRVASPVAATDACEPPSTYATALPELAPSGEAEAPPRPDRSPSTRSLISYSGAATPLRR